MQGCRLPQQRSEGDRWIAVLVLFAIGFLLLAPDPHDHGDVGSLGGLLRLFAPSPGQAADPHQTADDPQSDNNGSCPIHFWYQVAATGLLAIFLLRVALGSLFRILFFVGVPDVAHLRSFHSRAPPAFLS